MPFSKITTFPALFRGPRSDTFVFTTAFRAEPNQPHIYYAENGRDFVPTTVGGAGWSAGWCPRRFQSLDVQDRVAMGPKLYIRRGVDDDFIMVGEVPYEYTPHVDSSAYTFAGMSDEERRLVDEVLMTRS